MNEHRYERKFYTNTYNKDDLYLLIKNSTAMFVERYKERIINSIYMDTPGLECYFDNEVGSTNKIKPRVRWYNNPVPVALEPYLEFKIKSGLVGKKEKFRVKDFETTKLNKEDFLSLVSEVPSVSGTIPVCLVSYSRRYFESVDKNFRLTIDSDIVYFKFDKFIHWNQPHFQQGVILELKYPSNCQQQADRISIDLPFRVTKFSKYMNAMSNIYG